MIAASHDTERNHILHLMDAPPLVSIPSTAAGFVQPIRETDEERAQRQARAAGLRVTTCPACGAWATEEEALTWRPGSDPARRTLLRCQGRPRCPVTTRDEPAESDAFESLAEMLGRTACEEETMGERTGTCLSCGQSIETDHGRKRCKPCQVEFDRERKRLGWLRTHAKRQGLPVPAGAEVLQRTPGKPTPAPAPAPVATPALTPAPVPAPVAPQPADDFGGLVRTVLALSPERQDLLRRLLAEVAA